jgi:hypothetical protein
MMRLITVCGRITRWLTHNALNQSLTDCAPRAIGLEALAIYATKRRLCRKPSDRKPHRRRQLVAATMWDVKVALEKANLNGFVYDASFQLHHKKPFCPMLRNPKKVDGGVKTARKPTSSVAPPLCNFCGGNHTMDACRQKGFPSWTYNADASIKWVDSAVGKAWKDRHDCNWRPGEPTVILKNNVKQGEQANKKAHSSRTSSGSRKRSKSPSLSCACLNCQQAMLTEMCGAQCASPTSSFTESPSIVQIRFNHSTEPLTIFCLFDSRITTHRRGLRLGVANISHGRSETWRQETCSHQLRLRAPQVVRRYHQLGLIFWWCCN